MPPLVEVSELRVLARDLEGRETVIVKNASFSVAHGEVVALIGESGSGSARAWNSSIAFASATLRDISS